MLIDSVFTRRGFKTHYGPWSTGGDHQTHITAADLRAPYTTLGYDFHDQVLFQLSIFIRLIWFPESRTLLLWVQLGTTPQTCLSTGCPTSSQSTLALRRASFSVVTPRAGFLDHHRKCQQNNLFQCPGNNWRKSQRNHS